jgi:DNA repair ATPase RecN
MRLFATALAVLTFTTLPLVPASAQNQTAQQERMKACNTQASNQKLAGDARRSFMSECLSGKTIAEKPATAQQQKMKDCNATASQQNLSGDKRKSFMSTCLKGPGG